MLARLRHFFRTLTGRLLVSAFLWSAVALTVGGFVLSAAFRSYVLQDVDERLSVLLDTLVGSSEVAPDGMLRFNRPLVDERFATPYSGLYWQVSEEGVPPFRSRSLWDFELGNVHADRVFTLHIEEAPGPDGQRLRVAERDIILPEADRIFRYQVASDLGEVQAAIERFNQLLLQALGLIMGTLTAALVLQVAYGLRPLRTIGKNLADVRAGREARLPDDWPADLQPLAAEINALIDQNEKLVARARTHVGNLAHALKTPLAVILNEADADKGPRGATVGRAARDIKSHIDHHLKRARIAGGGSGPGLPVRERLDKLAKAIAAMHRHKDIELSVECAPALAFDGEREDFDEMLGNLMDNAGKWSAGQVSVSVKLVEKDLPRPMLEIRVEDDGPGVPEDQWQVLFERGRRLDEHVQGTGLGLAIVRDIVDMYGGSVRPEHAALGGLAIVMRLPGKLIPS
ncbi:sensor histidine kinase [Gimibacter soli]|uniref:histidine kinase n=1 Tax=Gimibacter soli TaxID=3024400 RepID=A0AAE9XUP1_9PROT|nr:sensor histidine kinase [Gimibacter soli]WCL55416.1 sensor histidine kinase [Gimibacter soli]